MAPAPEHTNHRQACAQRVAEDAPGHNTDRVLGRAQGDGGELGAVAPLRQEGQREGLGEHCGAQSHTDLTQAGGPKQTGYQVSP